MSKARGLADLGNAYSDGALSNRNLIINGAMQVWQRGTSGTTGYVADRFLTSNTTSVSKVSSSLTGFGSAMRIVANSSDPIVRQNIENTDGYLAGQIMTLSFWMKSDIADPFDAGQYCQYNDGSEVGQLLYVDVPSVIETNGDWKRYSRTFTLPTTATGSKFNARIDFNETTGQTLDITGVQLEIGDTATPFEHRSIGQELALCQRFYTKSYPADVTPAIAANAAEGGFNIGSDISDTGRIPTDGLRFPVEMRANPTLTLYPGRTTVTATSGYISKYNGNNITAVSNVHAGTRGFRGYIQAANFYDQYSMNYTADAEL